MPGHPVSTWILGLLVLLAAVLFVFGNRWDDSAESHYSRGVNFLAGFLCFSMWTMGTADPLSRTFQAVLFAGMLGYWGFYIRERFGKPSPSHRQEDGPSSDA
jgi:hypothetical protein